MNPNVDAERIVKKHGGSFTPGQWNRAHGMTEEQARALWLDLNAKNYQTRQCAATKGGKWEVVFR